MGVLLLRALSSQADRSRLERGVTSGAPRDGVVSVLSIRDLAYCVWRSAEEPLDLPSPGQQALELVGPGTMCSSTSVSHAKGSTPFSFAVATGLATIAQRRAPPSEPATRAFFRPKPDGFLYGVVIELEPAVLQEQHQRLPAAQGVADRRGQAGLARNPRQLGHEASV
jgi:hypothetical protein